MTADTASALTHFRAALLADEALQLDLAPIVEPESFAAEVMRLADDPAAAAALGQGGLARVRESFSWDASRARWARVLGAYLDGELS